MNKKLTMAEFYERYYQKPEVQTNQVHILGKEYWDMFLQAEKEGKQLIMIKRRGFDWDGYMCSLIRTGTELINGNKVLVLSKPHDKIINDLNKFFGINTEIEKGTFFLKLKSITNKVK